MSPETYWKRRVFVLAGLLVVVALIVYACSRPSSDEGQRAADSGAATEETPDESASPSIPASPSASDAPSASPAPGGEEGGGDSGGDSGGGSGGGSDDGDENRGAGKDGAIPAPEQPEDLCRPDDVVTTLSADREDYSSGVEPRFDITVVNTDDQTCTVDVGPKAMELRITSGEDRVFSTADCVRGDGTDKEQLRRGVPHTVTVEWDRERSWEDCRDSDVNARAGTYVASLKSDYDNEAEDQVFRLN
ncbi:hypothetical protein HDA32_005060 [Spinactinospora alkalitolerans]|uniref:DUF4232 domain-containing protein n=1 Tax=Spinactinospora alkalitolerans TaxID=687207 RepID=A0A852U7P1_9ACTN|nr:hypothetical protein [Spinactinospora alkalitolerans]NYE49940.1 hypothetical protein [Spinactinospora alkalitolerans]